ncbi:MULTISPECIES: hypothetical protein [unclassified Variovorax]|uniref:hypothetical protein n=1 Tax=unclassified Variovorax TaxID=663243 RepID=UPI00076D35E2|nr:MULTISPECIES: hypothetical protein [unclassified Variovorax]KWT81125.1 hypothetical protein APY03_5034 [Variovorax sp. WDL1]PNG45985.1 hypothetical protein CHC06_07963 [Variovorax sp. B2]PNG46358.1 hypothetical protein CHC07_08106 [Variovorax sp. B4]VTV19080.1 hypothetical protein WDL1P3_00032 [Variovorax sp. WDL1]
MEPALVLRTATTLLILAAVGGLVMAGIRFFGTGDRWPPRSLAMLHGFLATAAITLLVYAGGTVGLPRTALIALVLLLVAAALGVTLNLQYHWKQLPLPRRLILVHAVVAAAGFLLLLEATWVAWNSGR